MGEVAPSQRAEGWARRKLGHLVRFGNGKDSKEVENADGLYPVYGSGGVFRRADSYLHDGPSILFGRKGTVDKPLLVNGRFWTVDTMFYTVPGPDVEPRFLHYWALTIPFETVATDTAVPSVTSMDLSQLIVYIPPLTTQSAIADYLDRETGEIDSMRADLDEMEALLRERRKTVVSNHFPEDGPTAPLWKFAEVSPSTPGLHSLADEDPVTFIPLEDVWTGCPSDLFKVVPWNQKLASYTHFQRGDILLPKVTPTVTHGRAMIAGTATELGVATSEVYTLRPATSTNPKWLTFFLTSSLFLDEAGASVFGTGGLKRISTQFVQSFAMPDMSREMQDEVVEVLERETAEIDSMLADIVELRDLLAERRAALISAAVTGQIDVPTPA